MKNSQGSLDCLWKIEVKPNWKVRLDNLYILWLLLSLFSLNFRLDNTCVPLPSLPAANRYKKYFKPFLFPNLHVFGYGIESTGTPCAKTIISFDKPAFLTERRKKTCDRRLTRTLLTKRFASFYWIIRLIFRLDLVNFRGIRFGQEKRLWKQFYWYYRKWYKCFGPVSDQFGWCIFQPHMLVTQLN